MNYTVAIFLVFYWPSQILPSVQAAACQKVCPPGWVKYPLAQNDHCYLQPPNPMKASFLTDFWSLQNYCKSKQPTSYVVVVSSDAEANACTLQTMFYLLQYALNLGTYWIWIGIYYVNGAWQTLDGAPLSYTNFVSNAPAPKNGSCVFIDPKSTAGKWSVRDCSDARGSAPCEMNPIEDCDATTGPPTSPTPYQSPDCQQSAWADFVKLTTTGYMSREEMKLLEGQTLESCAAACLYYDGCLSFDFDKNTGECRLMQVNSQYLCNFSDNPPGEWQHYDLVASSKYGGYDA